MKLKVVFALSAMYLAVLGVGFMLAPRSVHRRRTTSREAVPRHSFIDDGRLCGGGARRPAAIPTVVSTLRARTRDRPAGAATPARTRRRV